MYSKIGIGVCKDTFGVACHQSDKLQYTQVSELQKTQKLHPLCQEPINLEQLEWPLGTGMFQAEECVIGLTLAQPFWPQTVATRGILIMWVNHVRGKHLLYRSWSDQSLAVFWKSMAVKLKNSKCYELCYIFCLQSLIRYCGLVELNLNRRNQFLPAGIK